MCQWLKAVAPGPAWFSAYAYASGEVTAEADPDDRLAFAGQCLDPVTDRQLFDRYLAPIREDQRAAAQAGDRAVGAGDRVDQ